MDRTHQLPDETKRPFHEKDGWQTLIYKEDSIDYWQIAPGGLFYHYRGFEDDFKSQPLKLFDFSDPIIGVAESIAVALAFAKKLHCDIDDKIDLYFKWTGLKRRELGSYRNRNQRRYISPGRIGYKNEVSSVISVPLNIPPDCIFEYVNEIVTPLFETFGDFSPPLETIRELVNDLLNKKY